MMKFIKKIHTERVLMRVDSIVTIVFSLMLLTSTVVKSAESEVYVIEEIDQLTLPGGMTQIRLLFDKPVDFKPMSFSMSKPARVSIDFPNTIFRKKSKAIEVNTGTVSTIRTVQGKSRSRLVVGLPVLVPYEIRTESNSIYINFTKQVKTVNDVQVSNIKLVPDKEVNELDFRRGKEGEGEIKLTLSDQAVIVNVEEKGTKLLIDIVNAALPEKLVRRLDVIDFATPIRTIDAFNSGAGSKIVIDTSGEFEHIAYQAGNEFIIDVKPLSAEEVAESKKDKYGYSGEPLSLNFQNIEVRAVLQLLADFTGLNVVASDTVQGNITLRLKNVPWDQALDIILRTRGLGMRKTGNVVLIAPNEELASREKKELEADKQKLELSPLHTTYFQINYAKAGDIASMLKADKNSILTERGSVTIDARTNTLMVLETTEKHEEIATLIEKLDVPIKQVMIEARIVIASDDFGRDIGVRLGVSGSDTTDILTGTPDTVAVTGSSVGADTMVQAGVGAFPGISDRYNVNLPASGAGRIAMAILGQSFLVDLELSALQTEGRGEVLSNPRVITSNQQTASIEQGVEIPYQEASSSGATSVSFKKAVLSLQVTPQITPDDRVVMDLAISKDSIGGIYSGVPSVNTRSINTQVLVDNGDTVVLGGIYEQEVSEGATKVPFLGDIPLLGVLFRTKSKKESKAELLIFVTPRILDDSLKVAQ